MPAERILGLVPARGGSKGLPGKNIRLLAGKPMIAWTIEAAARSGVLTSIVVTTDDDRIAQIAAESGADVLRRPEALAGDTTPMIDVVMDALNRSAPKDGPYTHVMLLQPTSPLRSADDIRGAVARLHDTRAKAVVSVCREEHHPLLSGPLPDDGSMATFLAPEIARANRQELPAYFRLNGAIYLAEIGFLERERVFIAEGTYAFEMPAERSIDIDTAFDLRLAEAVIAEPGE